MIDEEVIHAAKPRSTTPAAARNVSPEHAEEEEEEEEKNHHRHHHHHHYKNNKKKWSSKFAAGLYPFVTLIYSLSGHSTNKCVNFFFSRGGNTVSLQCVPSSGARVCVRAGGHALLMGVNCTVASGCRLLLHLFKCKSLKINQKGSWERKESENPVIGLVSPRPLKLSCR